MESVQCTVSQSAPRRLFYRHFDPQVERTEAWNPMVNRQKSEDGKSSWMFLHVLINVDWVLEKYISGVHLAMQSNC